MFRTFVLVVVLLFTLAACKSGTSYDMYKDAQMVASITDEATKNKIAEAFKAKQQVFLKKMPEFEYKIVVNNEGSKEEWLFSSLGVIKKDEAGAETYRVSIQPEMLLQ